MNFIIKSYLCDPKKIITDITKLKENPSLFLVDIDDIKAIEKIKASIDLDYIDGALYIQFGEQIISDYTNWDLVDQLWSYIISAIQIYISNGYGSSHFPDQPIRFEIEKSRDSNVLFRLCSLQKKEWLLPESQFLSSLLEGATHFFSRLKEFLLIDESNFNYEIDRIEKIKNEYLNKKEL